MNSRLDEMQAAILEVKLKYLDDNNFRRVEIANHYRSKLSAINIKLPVEKCGYRHVFHQYVVKTNKRDGLQEFLLNKNINTSVLYPQPVHLQEGYKSLCCIGVSDLSKTEKACKELLCLPIYPELSDDDVDYVCDTILEWAGNSKE
jgi:dTDP-4-amino-4,6-dideoxygalactose transaminase